MIESLDLLNQWLAIKQKDGNFLIPPDARPTRLSVISEDDDLEPVFLRGLYTLELAMLDNYQNPEDFFIRKYRALPGAVYPGAADTNVILYGYEIIFNDKRYSVRRKSDMDFLAYFSTLVLGNETDKPDVTEPERRSLLGRISSWLKSEAF